MIRAGAYIQHTQAGLKAHPVAEIFPLIEGVEFEALVEDIRQNGQHDPVIVHDAMILENIEAKPEGLAEGPQVGDVYPLLGGTYRSDGEVARYRVVIGIRRNTVIFLTFDSKGEVCGATQYGLHAIEHRLPIGRVRNMPIFDVEWFP